MKARTAEASRLEADYLNRARAALKGRADSEVEEILQSLREHIEEEVSENLTTEVSLTLMANILERLGPPEAYAQEEGVAHQEAPSAHADVQERRISPLALVSALCLPAAILVGILVGVVAHRISGRDRPSEATAWLGVLSGTAILVAGLILGVAALRSIRSEPENLSGRRLAWIGVFQLPVVWLVLLMWLMSSSKPAKPAIRTVSTHRAQAILEFRPESPLIADPAPSISRWEEFYRAQVSALRSTSLVEQAVARLPEPYRRENSAKDLASRLVIEPVRSSFLLKVGLVDPDPELALVMVRSIVEVYLKQVEKDPSGSVRIIEAAHVVK